MSDNAYIRDNLECKHNTTANIDGGTIGGRGLGGLISVPDGHNCRIIIKGGIINGIQCSSTADVSNEIGIVGYNLSKIPIVNEESHYIHLTGNWNDGTPFVIPLRGEFTYPLVVLYDGVLPPEPLPSLQDQITALQQAVEVIELIPGPEGPLGPQGVVGPQGEQGLPGVIPTEIQTQITALQQENAALLQQVALLQQIAEQNRQAMEQFNPLRKLLEELGYSQGLLGDINNDGKIDSADLEILTSHWLEGTQ